MKRLANLDRRAKRDLQEIAQRLMEVSGLIAGRSYVNSMTTINTWQQFEVEPAKKLSVQSSSSDVPAVSSIVTSNPTPSGCLLEENSR